MFICCLIRLHDTKSDIGSPVDLVDAIILWHVMACTAKKKKKKTCREAEWCSVVCVRVVPVLCDCFSSVHWGSSLVTDRLT